MSANTLAAGAGGIAGTGNTGNGGDGGNGGNGGNAEGGGLYEGDNTTLALSDSTFGGVTLSTDSNPFRFSNILTAGNGGAGGNGGTAGKTLNHSNGGDGGAGGNVEGGGVYVDGGTATLTNDTILNNVANLVLTSFTGGAGGSPGDAAGSGLGVSGKAGANGSAAGGGLFSQATAVTDVGNTIIDLNTAGTNLNNTPPGSVARRSRPRPTSAARSSARGTTSSATSAHPAARTSRPPATRPASPPRSWTSARSRTTAGRPRPTDS